MALDTSLQPHRNVTIDYTNWRGERGARVISPGAVWFGCNEWHQEPQWLLSAYDVEKQAHRDFAMAGIHSWAAAPDNASYTAADQPITPE